MNDDRHGAMNDDRHGAVRGLGATPRRAALLFGLSLLAACAPDYSAVRDWSVQARETLLPPASVRPATGLAQAPAPPAEVTAEGREGAVRALQEAAAAWLGALAYMADDGLPRGRTNSFGPLAARVLPFDAEGAAAVDALGETLAFGVRRNWRAPQLRVAVERGNAPFQGVIAALARQTEALAREAPGTPAAQDQAAARRAALALVGEGHALLEEREGRLAAGETARRLRLQESELRRLMARGGGG
jgi:hypothetical protein